MKTTMNTHDKQRLMNKIARMAYELGYDVARLSTAQADQHASDLSDAVGQLRLVQGRLALDIHHAKQGITA